MSHLQEIADRLDHAATVATAVPQLAEPLTLEDAYEVQRLSIARRMSRGEGRLGFKMGLTSKAKMVQVGVSEMNWGRLTKAMLIEDGGALIRSKYVHPRAEPEIAFLLKRPLQGTVSVLEANTAIDGIAAAIEVIDSRYRDFKFSLTDVVADNSSSSAVTFGPWHRPDVDISNLGMILSADGKPCEIGSSAAILGHPLRALVAAARLLALREERLEAGDILLAGAATAAQPLSAASHIRVETETLGGCAFSVQ